MFRPSTTAGELGRVDEEAPLQTTKPPEPAWYSRARQVCLRYRKLRAAETLLEAGQLDEAYAFEDVLDDAVLLSHTYASLPGTEVIRAPLSYAALRHAYRARATKERAETLFKLFKGHRAEVAGYTGEELGLASDLLNAPTVLAVVSHLHYTGHRRCMVSTLNTNHAKVFVETSFRLASSRVGAATDYTAYVSLMQHLDDCPHGPDFEEKDWFYFYHVFQPRPEVKALCWTRAIDLRAKHSPDFEVGLHLCQGKLNVFNVRLKTGHVAQFDVSMGRCMLCGLQVANGMYDHDGTFVRDLVNTRAAMCRCALKLQKRKE